VETVGLIPQDFPRFAWPQPQLVAELWPAAAGIALMSFTESIAAARAFAQASEPRPAPNRELLALGLANAAGGLLGAMPSGGGTTQTAVNRRAGARTQLAELVTAGAAVATLLFLAPLLSLMPAAVLAAVVIAYSVELFKPAEFAELRRVRHIEFRWAIIACAGVVFLGTLRGILVAVIASLVALAHQAYNPPVYVLGRKRGSSAFRPLTAADQTWPGLLILRTEGRMFFANAPGVGERMYALIHAEHPSVVVLDCSAIPDIEYTALEMLAQADEKLRADGVELWLAALNPEPFAMVNRSRLGQALGRTRIFFSLEMALYKWESRDGRQAKA
ncbi:MAG: STAS domain-containing protein, partial [Burkholderia sp.]|nr:STAS domain-containing protein [Burkholderia sp.]